MRSFLKGWSGGRGGGVLLPRKLVARRAQVLWPKCKLCMRSVDAYGYENETDAAIEVWAVCNGVRIDPQSGSAVHGAPKVHETKKDSVVIRKGPGWSHQRLTDLLERLAFFDPQGERDWKQDLSFEGAKPS